MWTHAVEHLRAYTRRVSVRSADAVLPYGRALDLLAHDAAFRDFLTGLLAGDAGPALRWETPPICHATLERPFEYVLIDDAHLEVPPEPAVFAGYFTGVHAQAPVRAIPNLGRTATLIVPRQLGEAGAYAHLARFLRHAPSGQVHALWQCVAQSAQQRLSDTRQWLSTAGSGVAWLHVRLDDAPKYYRHRPYAESA